MWGNAQINFCLMNKIDSIFRISIKIKEELNFDLQNNKEIVNARFIRINRVDIAGLVLQIPCCSDFHPFQD